SMRAVALVFCILAQAALAGHLAGITCLVLISLLRCHDAASCWMSEGHLQSACQTGRVSPWGPPRMVMGYVPSLQVSIFPDRKVSSRRCITAPDAPRLAITVPLN